MKKILMSGGQGDSIYCNDFLKIITYLKQTKSDLQLSLTTNGSYKKKNWWKEVALTLNENDIVMFSVDGWDQESNEKYRVNSHFDSIMQGLKTLRQFNDKVYIIWSTIIFKFNQDKLNVIQDLAEKMGADAFNVVQSSLFGSFDSTYIDSHLNYDPLEPDKDFLGQLNNTNRGFYIRFNTNRSSPKVIEPLMARLIDKYKKEHKKSYIIPLCRIGERGLYVDAEGILYPCSWISHPFDVRSSASLNKSIQWNKSLWVEYKDRFNLNKHSLEDILQSSFWNKLTCSWRNPKKTFIECEEKCHRSKSEMRVARLQSKIFFNKDRVKDTFQVIEKYKKNIQEAVRKK